MRRIATITAALLIAGTAGAFAQGASQSAPGHQAGDAKKDAMPGQSGHAPGHQSGDAKKDAMPGQSGYAPGHNKETTGASGDKSPKGPDKK
jgi:hypothetical protein